jgi:hypothetical protein
MGGVLKKEKACRMPPNTRSLRTMQTWWPKWSRIAQSRISTMLSAKGKGLRKSWHTCDNSSNNSEKHRRPTQCRNNPISITDRRRGWIKQAGQDPDDNTTELDISRHSQHVAHGQNRGVDTPKGLGPNTVGIDADTNQGLV